MAIRFYLLPVESTAALQRGPKYLPWRFDPDPPALVDVPWGMIDFGLEPAALVAADLTTPQHNALIANLDVTSVPVNLDNAIGASAAQTAEEKLESYGIPANWLVTGMTWRRILRATIAIFRVAQRFNGLGATRIVVPGVTLSTPYSAMPVDYRSMLLQAIDDLGYDRSTLTAQSTLRDLLTSIAGQSVPASLLMGVEI